LSEKSKTNLRHLLLSVKYLHLTCSTPSTCIHVIFVRKNVYFCGIFSLIWVWNGPSTKFMYSWLSGGWYKHYALLHFYTKLHIYTPIGLMHLFRTLVGEYRRNIFLDSYLYLKWWNTLILTKCSKIRLAVYRVLPRKIHKCIWPKST